MFVTSKSTLFTTFFKLVLHFSSLLTEVRTEHLFFVAFRRNLIYKGFRIRGLLQCLYFFDIHDYSRVKPVKIPKPVSVLNINVLFFKKKCYIRTHI